MHKKTILFFLLYTIHLSANQKFFERIKSFFQACDFNNKKIKFQCDDLSGTVPYKFFLILNELKNLNEQKNNLLINRLILHGPTGNGKSTYAKKLANEIDAILFKVDSSLLISHLQGSGSNNIRNIFETAFTMQKEQNKKIVIFFDGIDSLLINAQEKRLDNESALQTLAMNLDSIKNDSNYFVILAACEIFNIPIHLLDRFGDNIIYLDLPDNQMRKEIIEFYSNKLELHLSEGFISYLVKHTNRFSIRAIEDALKSLKAFSNKNENISYSLINSILNAFIQKNKMTEKSEGLYNRLIRHLQHLNIILNICPSFVLTVMAFNFLFNKKDTNKFKDSINALISDGTLKL